ncbi:MAG: TolC family protein [Chryseolinea sp.]
MKPILPTLLICILFSGAAMAQASGDTTTTFTLDNCIRYALENTVEIKNARVDQQIAQAKVKETTGLGLPQISGSVTLQHNQKLSPFFANYATAQGFAGKNPDGSQKLDLGLEPGDIVASPNFFQLPSSGNASLNINQLLFSTTYLVGLKAASTYRELSQRSQARTEVQVVEKVIKAYYAVLVNNERIGLFDNNIARVDSLLRNTAALNKNGFAEEIDVDRIQVTLNNLKAERLKFLNLQSLSLGLLKYQMNYPMDKEMNVTGELDEFVIDENSIDDYQQGWDYKNRVEYRLLETQRELYKLDVKNKNSNSHPSLSGFVNMGYITQSPTIGGIFKTNTSISETSLGGPDKWYPFSLYGITLNVPIFSGLQRNYQTQQAKLTLLKTENEFISLRQTIDLGIQQNTTSYKNAVETVKSQRENMALAEKVAKITKIKYEQGVGSNIEVIDAESSLRESQVNYYNALFDAITSKTDVDAAYGKIDPSKYVSAAQTK